MKKYFCVLLALLLCVSSIACASADGVQRAVVPVEISETMQTRAACNHQWRKMSGIHHEGWYPVETSDMYHEYREYHASVCDKCGDEVLTFKASQLEVHTMVANGDQHLKGMNKHKFFTGCKCGKEDSFIMGCNGTGNGDCQIPLLKALDEME